MSEMKKIGFLGPQAYMERALVDMRTRYDIEEITIKGWEPAEINAAIEECKAKGVVCVGGFAQKDALHHILVNEGLGNVSLSRMAFLYCMNKYLMRKCESNPRYFDWVDPATESDDEIIAKIKEWPFMLKNTSLSLGRGIFRIPDEEKLRTVLAEYRGDKALIEEIDYLNKCLTRDIPEAELPEKIPPFIAEHLVDINTTIEYCYEGYITPAGKVVHYALTEEVYFKNHQALGYMTPPFSFPASKAPMIEAWIDDYMGKLSDLGYRGQFFNIEFWHNPADEIVFTEINPRAAHSYHYNYLYSFGTSLFEDNLELAHDGSEPATTPWKMWKEGDIKAYTLIALITTIGAGKVSEILDYEYVKHLEEVEGILVRHCKQADDVLTDADVTAAGVMLLQIWVTGKEPQDCVNKEIEIRSKIYLGKEEYEYPESWKATEAGEAAVEAVADAVEEVKEAAEEEGSSVCTLL